MLVRQAIVSSPRSRALRDNEIVALSEGIDDELAWALCEWTPGNSGLDYGQNECLSYFRPNRKTFAVARSVGSRIHAGEEGRRVVSKIVLFDRAQAAMFRHNLSLMIHVLLSDGLLVHQPTSLGALPLLEAPDGAFQPLGEYSHPVFADEVERIVHAVQLHRRVVVLGVKNAIAFMCSFLADIPMAQRLQYSFAAGMKIDDSRPFALQFFPEVEPELVMELASLQIRTIALGVDQIAYS